MALETTINVNGGESYSVPANKSINELVDFLGLDHDFDYYLNGEVVDPEYVVQTGDVIDLIKSKVKDGQ